MFKKLTTADILMLLSAFLSLVFSETLWFTGNKEGAIFIGLWVPSILGFAIYLKLLNAKKWVNLFHTSQDWLHYYLALDFILLWDKNPGITTLKISNTATMHPPLWREHIRSFVSASFSLLRSPPPSDSPTYSPVRAAVWSPTNGETSLANWSFLYKVSSN